MQAKGQLEQPAEAQAPAEAAEEEAILESAALTATTETPAPVSGVELPDWLQEMSMEEAPAIPTPPATPVEPAEETALPDWLQEISLEEEHPSQVEATAQVEPETRVEPLIQQPAEAEIQPPAILSAEETGMAWLESLAAKQGVPEEELTTRPEERPEAPPAWVQEEAAIEQPAAVEQPGAVEQAVVELPGVMETPAVEEQATLPEQPSPVELEAAPGLPEAEQQVVAFEPVLPEELPATPEPTVIGEPAAVEGLPAPAGIEAPSPEAAPLPDWLQQMAATEEPPSTAEESAAEPQVTAEVPPSGAQEAIPPLPAWLENAGEEEAVEPLESAAVPLVNINNASLVELENLPGLGFILAQAIINHRTKHGPFSRIDDLVAVQGFNPGIVAEISDKITTGEPAAPAAPAAPVSAEVLELEGIEQYEAELMKARNAMVAGEVDSTLTHYGRLIKKEQLLTEVIRDLHEALYRYPVDANIWTALGDAYMHNNQLQEALDSYVKAEELIR
jgi:competence ComEA-like helix-hairpin-helix protein